MDNNRRPVNCITVLCDPRRVQRIAITCRCSLRWVEFIPQELHDSDMIAQFECSRCATKYNLYHKQLSRVKEDYDKQGQRTTTEFAHITTKDTSGFDA